MLRLLLDFCVKDKAIELQRPKCVSSLQSSPNTEMSFRTTDEFLVYIKQRDRIMVYRYEFSVLYDRQYERKI